MWNCEILWNVGWQLFRQEAVETCLSECLHHVSISGLSSSRIWLTRQMASSFAAAWRTPSWSNLAALECCFIGTNTREWSSCEQNGQPKLGFKTIKAEVRKGLWVKTDPREGEAVSRYDNLKTWINFDTTSALRLQSLTVHLATSSSDCSHVGILQVQRQCFGMKIGRALGGQLAQGYSICFQRCGLKQIWKFKSMLENAVESLTLAVSCLFTLHPRLSLQEAESFTKARAFSTRRVWNLCQDVCTHNFSTNWRTPLSPRQKGHRFCSHHSYQLLHVIAVGTFFKSHFLFFEMLRGADIVQGMLDKAAAKGCEARNSNAQVATELFWSAVSWPRKPWHSTTESLWVSLSLSLALYVSLKVEGTIQGHLAHWLAVWKRVQERSGRVRRGHQRLCRCVVAGCSAL